MAMFQNRSTQKDVRDWFNENGLKGDSLTFDYLELYALKPPGWEQIFTFEVDCFDSNGNKKHLYGLVSEDERALNIADKIEVEIYMDKDLHQKTLEEWSDGFIKRKNVKGRKKANSF